MLNTTNIVARTMVVILAAGKGTRMGKAEIPKVCFQIDGNAAINRIISTFKKKGFQKFLVVVGSKAEHVMETISAQHQGVLFVLQQHQQGTGHAAKVAAQTLKLIGHNDEILLTMGDKYLESEAVDLLVDSYIKKKADFALLVLPKKANSRNLGGRVFLDSKGFAAGIIENVDFSRQFITDELKKALECKIHLTPLKILTIINKYIPDVTKQKLAVPEILKAVENNDIKDLKLKLNLILSADNYNLSFGGKNLSAKQIDKKCKYTNPSLYILSATAFYEGVSLIKNNNAQKEFYLTDLVKILAGLKESPEKNKYRVIPAIADNCNIVQGFNSPDELLVIQDYVRQKKDKTAISQITERKSEPRQSQYCTVLQWIKKIEENGIRLKRWMKEIYGQHEDLQQKKQKDILKLLRCYGNRFGFDNKVIIVRAPGRINLMGRHVDHRGGYNNFLAIHRETLVVAGLREDNNVIAVNIRPMEFSPQSFNIIELMGQFGFSDWSNFVNSDWVRNMLSTTEGNWGNYIKAAILRLQHQYQNLKIFGLNIALSGDIPMAAGLSSSSSIVVAILQAAIALNGLELEARQFIDLCGEGEWFVGSRGGSGDHAAIYLGQRGKIANVGYLPFKIEKIINAPQDYQIVIADSHIKAMKSGFAKHVFNSKICTYNLGFELLKLRCPQITNHVEHLRDINPLKLGCDTSDIYKLLMKIPQYMTRSEFKEMLPRSYKTMIEVNFSTHDQPLYYNVRGVLLFGIAEIMRSKICVPLIEDNQMVHFGQLMKNSHDGDRVSLKDKDGQYHNLTDYYDDNYLSYLINCLKSEDPQKVLNAQLYMQAGSYGCSTPDIDCMVDIACSVPGVAGAQIAGAGLGGCIMVIIKRENVNALKNALIKYYYEPRHIDPEIIRCVTVKGAGLLDF